MSLTERTRLNRRSVSSHEDFGSDPLFGAFRQIKEMFPHTPVQSFYEGEFAAYGGEAAWSQAWDTPAIAKLVLELQPRHLVDLCSGDGRVAWGLREFGYSRQITCVDSSAAAEISFHERWSKKKLTPVLLRADILIDSPPRLTADCVVLGNVSVNSFWSTERLRRLLAYARELLADDGVLILIAYNAAVLSLFEELSGAMDAVESRSESGTPQLLWRGVSYSNQEFRQNYFIEVRDTAFPGKLGVLREHIWTSAEVCAMGELEGFHGESHGQVHVDAGGAAGWPCDVLLLRKQP